MYEFSVNIPVKRDNFSITPFTVNKRYHIYTSSLSERGYTIYEGRYYNRPTPVSSSKASNDPINPDGVYMAVAYRSLNNMFYKNDPSEFSNLELPDIQNTQRYLHLTSSVLYIPYYDKGEGVQPHSLLLIDRDSSINIKDDGLGNIYDTSVPTSSIHLKDNVKMSLRFDNLIKYTKRGYGYILTGSLKYESTSHSPEYEAEAVNVTLSEGLPTSSYTLGSSLDFSSSYVHLKTNQYLDIDNINDYSVSFWVKGGHETGDNYQYIISKQGTLRYFKYGDYKDYNESGDIINRRGLYPVTEDVNTTMYPLSIKYISTGSNQGKIVFEKSNGDAELSMISTSSIDDGNYHHVCFTKTGSNVYLYLDGVVESSGSDISGVIHNEHDYIIGSLNRKRDYSFSGSIHDFNIFNTGLSSNDVNNLYDTSSMSYRFTNVIGNIFYKSGVLSITSPHKKYINILSNNFELFFKNTVTHYEFETVCVIKKDKLNHTLNPSSTEYINSEKYLPEIISGSMSPYITTVGLYNYKNELVAVGKLSSPLKTRDDVDMNIIVRFDY